MGEGGFLREKWMGGHIASRRGANPEQVHGPRLLQQSLSPCSFLSYNHSTPPQPPTGNNSS